MFSHRHHRHRPPAAATAAVATAAAVASRGDGNTGDTGHTHANTRSCFCLEGEVPSGHYSFFFLGLQGRTYQWAQRTHISAPHYHTRHKFT